jgi:hypothetical protein
VEPNDLADVELFISHASEDKDGLVRSLAGYLQRAGVSVWYDEFTLTAGDSLSRSIDKGLATARYGLVVISPHFVSKRWPEYELRGLTAKEMSGSEKVIIPILHNITPDALLAYSPALADKISITTAAKSVPEIAEAVLRAIRPELARKVSLLRKMLRATHHASDVISVPLDEIAVLPLPDKIQVEGHVMLRALNIVNTLGVVAPDVTGDLRTFIGDLCRDLHPEPELRVWEAMTAAYLATLKHFVLEVVEREALVKLLLACSLGNVEGASDAARRLPAHAASYAVERWKQYADMLSKDLVVVMTGSGDGSEPAERR